jgi:transcriptional regulator with XRE-family HTH domain
MRADPPDDLADEGFRGLLLRFGGRTGLTQRALAARLGAHPRSVQGWEAGATHPDAGHRRALVAALLAAGGLGAGREAAEAAALWAAARREAAPNRAPLDRAWLADLLAGRAPAATAGPVATPAAGPGRLDWGEAPEVVGFHGRAGELETLGRWVLADRCRVVALLGLGGIGKTALAARLAHELAPTFERVYWRGLRDAPPASEWLAGALGFVSDRRTPPPAGEAARRGGCWRCCGSGAACSSWTTSRRCCGRASRRRATGPATAATAPCSRCWGRAGTGAACC